MKIRELQERLSGLDPELEVVCYSEDEKLLAEGRGLLVLEIVDIGRADAEQLRLEDDTPYLRFGKGPGSAAVATIELTSDF